MNDRYGIGKEKTEWLNKIKAIECKEPVIYVAGPRFQYSLSEKYLKETPLKTIKEHYDRAMNGLQ